MTQFSDDPFASPRQPSSLVDDRPQVYPPTLAKWQLVYVVFMLVLYLAVAIAGLARYTRARRGCDCL